MSAGKSALTRNSWDSVTAIVSMQQAKEDLWSTLRDLLTKCSLSRNMSKLSISKGGTPSTNSTMLSRSDPQSQYYNSAPTR